MFDRNYTGENRRKTSRILLKGFAIPNGFVLGRGYIRPFDRIVTNRGVMIVLPKSRYIDLSTATAVVIRPKASILGV